MTPRLRNFAGHTTSRDRFSTLVIGVVALMTSAGAAAANEPWNIKCFLPTGYTIAVKAVSADRVAYDVKAIPTDNPDQHDVKVLLSESDEPLPIKIVAPADPDAGYMDVKGIENGEDLVEIKGISGTGEILPVKAFRDEEAGRYDVKCLAADGGRLGLKAISPEGMVYDVKGIDDLPGQEELGIEIEAHVKAIPQG